MEEGLPQESAQAEPKDKLLLIVDDDASMLDLIEHMAKREGFRTERCSDGQEAIRKVEALSPALLILDFMLPGMGGFEVLKELQTGDARSIPVIVVTGRKVDPQTRAMIKQEPNVRDYIEKPVRPAQLMSLVHKILNTRPPEISRRQDRGPMSSGGW